MWVLIGLNNFVIPVEERNQKIRMLIYANNIYMLFLYQNLLLQESEVYSAKT